MSSTQNIPPSTHPEGFHAVLGCIECDATYSIHTIRYRCKCGGLLEVRHDMDRLKKKSAGQWKNLFVERYRQASYPYDSGIWGKKEWVLPEIDDEHIVSLGEGATPLVPVARLAEKIGVASLHIKQCGISHSGSFKDLGMTVLVSHVRSLMAKGLPIRAVAAASSGDTSAALASYGAAAGIPTIVFLPSGKITTAQLVQPLSNGAIVISLDTDFDGCMRVVKEVTADQGIYLANSMNPLRIEGQKTISIEILQQLGWNLPDWIVIPGGNLGNVSALAAGFKMLKETGIIERYPRIVLAQSANANPMVLSYRTGYSEYKPVQAKKTLASAIQIGDPVSYPRAWRALQEFDGIVDEATENELSDAAALADIHGMFMDPHTGVAFAVLRKLIGQGHIGKDDRVVVVSTAHGLKFSEFKTGYHEGNLEGVESKYKNNPITIAPDVDEVKKVIESRLNSIS